MELYILLFQEYMIFKVGDLTDLKQVKIGSRWYSFAVSCTVESVSLSIGPL